MASWKYYQQRCMLTAVATCLLFMLAVYLYHPRNGNVPSAARKHVYKKFPATCNLTWFKEELRLDDDPPVIPRELLSTCRRIIYNRIPKCGSRTFRDVFSILSKQRNLTYIYIDQNWWTLTEGDYKKAYIENMRKTDGQFILTSHFYFYEFSELFDPDTLVYIDISREPSSWFESVYSWNKYGSAEQPFSVGKHVNLSETLADCIRKPHERCVRDLAYAGTLRFLCGTDAVCNHRNYSELSVSKAWQNVERHYLVIGLLEDLSAFMEVLEYLMPHIFSDIYTTYTSVAETTTRRSQTLHKQLLDSKSKLILTSQLKFEYLIYNRIKEEFYKLVKAIQKLKTYDKNRTNMNRSQ